MKYAIVDGLGRVIASGDSGVDPTPAGAISTGEVSIVPDRFFYLDGKFHAIPDQPTTHHVFDYQTKSWVLDLESASAVARAYRNNLLRDSDWIVTSSAEFGSPVPQEWREYRQALRDITDQEGFPENIVWPTPPE